MPRSSIPATRRRCSRISNARGSRCRRSSPRTTMATTSAATRRCSRAFPSRCSAPRGRRSPGARMRSRRATRSPCRDWAGRSGCWTSRATRRDTSGTSEATRTAGIAFVGDTLFAGGCGRLFEGTPAQMADSLGKLAALPADTRVYCAHEYTLANLRFALAVEPGNAALQARLRRDQDQARPRVADGAVDARRGTRDEPVSARGRARGFRCRASPGGARADGRRRRVRRHTRMEERISLTRRPG